MIQSQYKFFSKYRKALRKKLKPLWIPLLRDNHCNILLNVFPNIYANKYTCIS